MKFDYIVMNPPYTDKASGIQNLDELFLKEAMKSARRVITIQPATWFLNDRKRIPMLQGRRCIADILSNGYDLFNNRESRAKVAQTLGIFMIDSGDGLAVTYDGKEKRTYDGPEDWSQADRHEILKTVTEKGGRLGTEPVKSHLFSQGHQAVKTLKDSLALKGQWTVKLTGQNKHIGLPDYDTIIFKEAGRPVLNDGLTRVGELFAAFGTQDEALHFYHYMMTDFVRTYVKAYRKGFHVSHAVRHIPWPSAGFTDDWDDDRIAGEIGLTDGERRELGALLPDCYGIRKRHQMSTTPLFG